ncbi:hypothetical protein M5X17_31310 [Paenibacillus alvei]|uniref:hypothetical protein n=1 Tax=Paenibacillus alvei TaxID=44250 RepID=UPI00227EA007|nr:hypothetical protein [Paenibacillus alvei]MCY9738183.1 hypothetical protein [Paenibacillus alvei]
MKDTSHLDALNVRLSHERSYLSEAKTEQERELRNVWIAQIEKEITIEKKFLGVEEDVGIDIVGDDELLNELFK